MLAKYHFIYFLLTYCLTYLRLGSLETDLQKGIFMQAEEIVKVCSESPCCTRHLFEKCVHC